jgi:hypothetical protein
VRRRSSTKCLMGTLSKCGVEHGLLARAATLWGLGRRGQGKPCGGVFYWFLHNKVKRFMLVSAFKSA